MMGLDRLLVPILNIPMFHHSVYFTSFRNSPWAGAVGPAFFLSFEFKIFRISVAFILPFPISTNVPMIALTICFKKPFASISKWMRPSRPLFHSARITLRTAVRVGVPTDRNDEKSCSPIKLWVAFFISVKFNFWGIYHTYPR